VSQSPIKPDRQSAPGMPRWVKVFVILFIVLIVIVIVLHLTGNNVGGHIPPHAVEDLLYTSWL
jgi:hypothetical protein